MLRKNPLNIFKGKLMAEDRETMATKEDVNKLRGEMTEGFRAINGKLDTLLDPQNGVYAAVNEAHTLAESAKGTVDRHELLLYGEDHAGGVVQTVKWVEGIRKRAIWAVLLLLTPFLLNWGDILWGRLKSNPEPTVKEQKLDALIKYLEEKEKEAARNGG